MSRLAQILCSEKASSQALQLKDFFPLYPLLQALQLKGFLKTVYKKLLVCRKKNNINVVLKNSSIWHLSLCT